jgi:hypothetical protein
MAFPSQKTNGTAVIRGTSTPGEVHSEAFSAAIFGFQQAGISLAKATIVLLKS